MNAFEQRFSHVAFVVDLLLFLIGFIFLVLLSSSLSFGVPLAFFADGLGDVVRSLLSGPLLYALVAVFYVVPYFFSGLYDLTTTRRFSHQIRKLLMIHILAPLALFFGMSLVLGPGALHPMAVLVFAVAMFVVAVVWRVLLRSLQRKLVVLTGGGLHHLVIIDDAAGTRSAALQRDIDAAMFLGYRIVGVLSSFDQAEIERIIEEDAVHDLILTGTSFSQEEKNAMMKFCSEHDIQFAFVPDVVQTRLGSVEMMSLAGYPMILVKGSGLMRRGGRFVKRLFDILVSLVALVILIPFYLVIAIIVKATSQGPVLFLNERVGRGRKNFHYLKFRTMKIEHCTSKQNPNVEQALAYEEELIEEHDDRNGPLYKVKDDPRLTSVGRVLRRWSLDELPSFWNVLVGDMSIVGPRPHQPREVAKYPAEAGRLFDAKPGITGLPQISGRADLRFEEEMRLDIYYIENWSFGMDVGTVLKTPIAVLSKKGSIV